ncbi:hypothetical protein ACFC0S_00750 [Streptomyces sp. NPDC056084]|uniref:hypothetical protein n=1 Tax=unclassified Streptomyces TaxID=2593676 RepID=UPI0035D7234B
MRIDIWQFLAVFDAANPFLNPLVNEGVPMSKRSLFDDVIKRTERLNKDTGKALRRGFKSTGKGSKKRAKRNERDIRELAGNVNALTQQVALLAAGSSGRSSAKD